jgi:hypothetical protein
MVAGLVPATNVFEAASTKNVDATRGLHCHGT